jgi:DNA-binding NarL/FixJ family response regulator
LSHIDGLAAIALPQAANRGEPLSEDFEIGRASSARARIASEIGAAMVHELNGPLTALLLYVGDIYENRNRIGEARADRDSLKRVVENAFDEARRICALVHRMGDGFEAPIDQETSIPAARDAIAWWSKTAAPNGGPAHGSDELMADGTGRIDLGRLTRRERQVLRLVSEGLSSKEGAKRLSISHRTFECYRSAIMRKLGTKNTAELVRLVLTEIVIPSKAPGFIHAAHSAD